MRRYGSAVKIQALLCLSTLTLTAFAGEPKVIVKPQPEVRGYAEVEAAYGFEADYDRVGSGSVMESRFKAGIIIPWENAPLSAPENGYWQWRLGVNYERFDFDHDSPLPLPDRLQGLSAVIGLELQISDYIAALLEIRPGVYFEDEITSDAFDIPVRLGIGYRVNDQLSLILMGRYRGFAENPVLGGVGFIWNISERLKLSAIFPEPRLTWQASDDVAIWLGGEWAGGAYRTDRDERGGRLNGAVVDYTDKRAAIGATWRRGDWQLEASAGVSFEREWDYHRAGEKFETDDIAPFVKLSAGAKW